MTHPILHDCPVCHDQLHVAALRCPSCATEVRGDFAGPAEGSTGAPAASGLDAAQQQLLRQLVAARGDLALVAREQRCDRAQLLRDLDELARAMGTGRLDGAPAAEAVSPSVEPAAAAGGAGAAQRGADLSREDVLAAVAQGRMDPAEAARLLRG